MASITNLEHNLNNQLINPAMSTFIGEEYFPLGICYCHLHPLYTNIPVFLSSQEPYGTFWKAA